MKTVANRHVLQSLDERLRALTPDRPRRWGTLTAHEMLCHLGDSTDMALGARPRNHPVRTRRRVAWKLLWLWCPTPWPRGVRTSTRNDPRAEGTRPSEFTKDMERAIAGLARVADARDGLEPAHGIFGAMSARDWQRWAYRHTDYHLRQFGA